MAQEKQRGCGYRKVHGTYLCGEGLGASCDRLPFLIKECQCCGFIPAFSRGIQRLNSRYLLEPIYETLAHADMGLKKATLSHLETGNCKDPYPKTCPICNPQGFYGLMWVGHGFYTPDEFIKEAHEMGVSKRIHKVPKWLEVGKTWILLAHDEVPIVPCKFKENGLNLAVDHVKAIFYAFKPQRIERLIWKSEATSEYIKELEEQGLTLIIIKDGDKDHMDTNKPRYQRKIMEHEQE